MNSTFTIVFLLAGAAPDFDKEVKPLLARSCVMCHNAETKRAGLRLDSARGLLNGGNSGPAVVPNKPEESLLVQALTGKEGVTPMPPKGTKLTSAEIELIKKWIASGANLPPKETIAVGEKPLSKHWAFQPIQRPIVPLVKNPGWCQNPIDRFVLAALEKEKMAPSELAGKSILLRRMSFDILGLPPMPDERLTFEKDSSPLAYEKMVDRILDAPQFGERWGRWWLDQARYADSNGYSIDGPRSIWKYRDWVIGALNENIPFDRFSTLQLAGDLVANATPSDRVATGFHRNTSINQEGGIDKEQFRVESVVDRVNTTGSVWLGLTIGCCQCHDHKFDPLSQREYYQFFAFFNTVNEPNLEIGAPAEIKVRDQLKKELKGLETKQKNIDPLIPARITTWEGKLQADQRALIPEPVQTYVGIAPNGRTMDQEHAIEHYFRGLDLSRHVVSAGLAQNRWAALADLWLLRQRMELEVAVFDRKARMPDISSTMVVEEMAKPRATHIHLSGEFTRKGALVEPAVPEIFPPLQGKGKPNRLLFSQWMFHPSNPLTARVIVNRVWQSLFGIGLVETDNDFGTQGALPTHPELLNWLAAEFQKDWDLKALIRLIMNSSTYRQSSNARPEYSQKDPRNRLLYRQNRIRLEAEVIRDAGLAASGLLTQSLGGPSVFPPQPAGVYAFTQVPKDWKTSVGANRYRRGFYTYFWRSFPHPGLVVFDAPDAVATCTRRNRSNTPLQALTLLNDEAHVEFARYLGSRLEQEANSPSARIQLAFDLCLGRAPNPREWEIMNKLLQDSSSKDSTNLFQLARVLLNLDEFITRE
ncbi:MAG: DUF1553 domain-containing protein [Gemmataceae bacterium]|nr:DUF1553 domain-containing protein [Gemmataceae bacterium]